VARLLTKREADVEKTLQNPFLSIQCWRESDRRGIRDRDKRLATSCNSYDKIHKVATVFLRLYTLRNQILHGAATDQGRRNRETLRSAVALLREAVPALIELVKLNHRKLGMLDALPYPPSHGDGGRFNPPQLKRAVDV
jgi:hypothetical protein